MSVSYASVGWNASKKSYDATIAVGLSSISGCFVGVATIAHPDATIETILIRALATAASWCSTSSSRSARSAARARDFSRCSTNRRYLGVTMFLVAAAHAVLAIVQFHALGTSTRWSAF